MLCYIRLAQLSSSHRLAHALLHRLAQLTQALLHRLAQLTSSSATPSSMAHLKLCPHRLAQLTSNLCYTV